MNTEIWKVNERVENHSLEVVGEEEFLKCLEGKKFMTDIKGVQ